VEAENIDLKIEEGLLGKEKNRDSKEEEEMRGQERAKRKNGHDQNKMYSCMEMSQ
jgi:hypothetical protein